MNLECDNEEENLNMETVPTISISKTVLTFKKALAWNRKAAACNKKNYENVVSRSL